MHKPLGVGSISEISSSMSVRQAYVSLCLCANDNTETNAATSVISPPGNSGTVVSALESPNSSEQMHDSLSESELELSSGKNRT